MSLTAGAWLGPYEILALLGTGGMGEVWKARDTRLNRIVAVKRLTAEHSGRLEQEARAIAALNHPHICQIYDVGPDYLVLEYIKGRAVADRIRTAGAPGLPQEELLRYARQIAEGLKEAHRAGILHRNLKPSNVMITTKGAAKLLDFGLARGDSRWMPMSDADASMASWWGRPRTCARSRPRASRWMRGRMSSVSVPSCTK